MANESVATPATDDSDAPSLVGMHPQEPWFHEQWASAIGGPVHWRASHMERALRGAMGVAAVLIRDERSKLTSEYAEIPYDGLSASDRESLAFALESLHQSAMLGMEGLRTQLTKQAAKDAEWVEIPVVGHPN